MAKRNQASQPTPSTFRYYRQGMHLPNSVEGSRRRGRMVSKEEIVKALNKKLQEHSDVTFGKIRVSEPLKKPPFGFSEEKSEESSDYVSGKVSKLRHEGYPQKQAVAIAYDYAKKKGYKV